MSRKNKFLDQGQVYFITCSVIKWFKIFRMPEYCQILIDSLKFCQENKGLIIYAWCIMNDHIHLIIGTQDQPMQNIIRDFKSFTSRKIRKKMFKNRRNVKISKIYKEMLKAGAANSNNKDWQLWQQHNHPQELFSEKIAEQKLNYIHYNPVKAGLVDHPIEWPYSSAVDYNGRKGLVDIEILR
ncbi:REP-associated tyrosine transposase [Gracilimonas sp.]|uniref:REP-associated tyrosine transposase n=1 Tax=Gracilimonas sp. TaxID=1974203 RepID=UPI002871543D|nr:transposase [Gracilimonas sp.]